MKIIDEFKAFAMKGNVMDMAVGIVIGGAFGKIVSSFVNDILMPPIGILIAGVNFKDLKISMGSASWNYGMFLQSVIDFLIIAFSIFMLVKALNKFKKKEEEKKAEEPAKSKEEILLTEIRDELRNKK